MAKLGVWPSDALVALPDALAVRSSRSSDGAGCATGAAQREDVPDARIVP